MVPFAERAGQSGPTTHYDLFAGLRDGGVRYLVTGATALVLHGVPRLTADIDLAVEGQPGNVARLERLFASWGYGELAATGGDAAVRRFRHPQAALGEIDVVLLPVESFGPLADRAGRVTLVDVEIPLVGEADLRGIKERAATEAAREDVAGLDALAALRAGRTAGEADTRSEQIRKFSRWSVAARLDWLLAPARLAKGLAPEARPMTRGLIRRRGWYGRR